MAFPTRTWSERLERHGQGHLLRGGTSWTTPSAARLEAEIAAIDLEQLDRLIAELVHGEPAATVPIRPRASRSR